MNLIIVLALITRIAIARLAIGNAIPCLRECPHFPCIYQGEYPIIFKALEDVVAFKL